MNDEMVKEIERAKAEGFIQAKIKYDLVEPTEDAILMCAKLIHATIDEMNRSMGEQILSWEASRDSLIAGINRVLDNPAETPGQNHDAWAAYRSKEGWVYGPVKSLEKKTHPCLVPFEELPDWQKAKDRIFLATVKTFFGL